VAVETTPVASPRSSASSSRVGTRLVATLSKCPRRMRSSTPSTPVRVFTPVIIAVIVPAESGTCESVV
jgi:hypothetical protein